MAPKTPPPIAPAFDLELSETGLVEGRVEVYVLEVFAATGLGEGVGVGVGVSCGFENMLAPGL